MNPPKGGNRRGQQRGGRNGAALIRGDPFPRGAARRRPTGGPGHSSACPPCAVPPRGGRSVGPPCGSRAHHHSGPPRCSQAHPCSAATPWPPCAFSPPVGAGALVLHCCRPRAEEPLAKHGRGDPLNPLGDARVVRRPAKLQASVIISIFAAISGNPSQSPPSNGIPSLHSKPPTAAGERITFTPCL